MSLNKNIKLTDLYYHTHLSEI